MNVLSRLDSGFPAAIRDWRWRLSASTPNSGVRDLRGSDGTGHHGVDYPTWSNERGARALDLTRRRSSPGTLLWTSPATSTIQRKATDFRPPQQPRVAMGKTLSKLPWPDGAYSFACLDHSPLAGQRPNGASIARRQQGYREARRTDKWVRGT